MKEIQLTQGKVALVDDEDFEYLNQFKWYALKDVNTFYAVRNIRVKGKQKKVWMHGEIMGGKGIDHIKHNGLNNQKENLRFCTHQENLMNMQKCKNTSSIYKGVHWDKHASKWMTRIMVNSKRIHLGLFNSEVNAAKAYDKEAKKAFGEFACLNNV